MHNSLLPRLPARTVLTGLLVLPVLLLGTPSATAQWRQYPEAVVGLDHIPLVVHDLEAASTRWRDLGFNVKPGATLDNGITDNHVKFEDGSGIELFTVPAAVDDVTTQYREMLEAGEGPVAFAFHARDLGPVRDAIDGNRRFDYQPVSRTLEGRNLEFLSFVQDSRAPDDAGYLRHPNGAKAMSRVWLAMDGGKTLRDMLQALNADATSAKVYVPEATQSYDMTLTNGEVLILPRSSQLLRGRQVIGATFEVEDLDRVRQRLDVFGIAWKMGGTEDLSVIVAPDATHGMWVEFRE
jgi:hypothetical protein